MRRVARWLVVVLGAGIVVLLLAGTRGYVPPYWQGGWGCTDVGYPTPTPSYDELVGEHGESPYCARRVRDEQWW